MFWFHRRGIDVAIRRKIHYSNLNLGNYLFKDQYFSKLQR